MPSAANVIHGSVARERAAGAAAEPRQTRAPGRAAVERNARDVAAGAAARPSILLPHRDHASRLMIDPSHGSTSAPRNTWLVLARRAAAVRVEFGLREQRAAADLHGPANGSAGYRRSPRRTRRAGLRRARADRRASRTTAQPTRPRRATSRAGPASVRGCRRSRSRTREPRAHRRSASTDSRGRA